MNYQQFVTVINTKTNQLLCPEAFAKTHTALKNNGTQRTGLTICQSSTNISPTIYLEEYYRHYQDGMELDEIAESIVRLYREVRFEHDWDVEQIKDFHAVKEKLAFKLINFEKNHDLLQRTPHVPYLDLAIVFFLLLETTEKGAATILITEEMLNYWKITLEELYPVALSNSPKLLRPEFKPMGEVINELMGVEYCTSEQIDESHMYVLSNQYRHFGAGCILYDRVLEDIANLLNEDFYILPSSIHETIILPASYNLSEQDLSEMVVDINETQVSEEEVLSDHVYYYSREENTILHNL